MFSLKLPLCNKLVKRSFLAQFPGVCGLKYRNPETHTMRGIKLLDGALFPPGPENLWKDHLYLTVYPKGKSPSITKYSSGEYEFCLL